MICIMSPIRSVNMRWLRHWLIYKHSCAWQFQADTQMIIEHHMSIIGHFANQIDAEQAGWLDGSTYHVMCQLEVTKFYICVNNARLGQCTLEWQHCHQNYIICFCFKLDRTAGLQLEGEDEEAFLDSITGSAKTNVPYLGKLRFRSSPTDAWSDLCSVEAGSHSLGKTFAVVVSNHDV